MPAGLRRLSSPVARRNLTRRRRGPVTLLWADTVPARRPLKVERVSPLLLGYQNASTRETLLAGERAVVSFAQAQGYTPGPMYVERGRYSALVALLEAAKGQNAAAVAVPTAADLGRSPHLQELLREKITQAAGVMVFVIEEFTP